VQNTFPPARMRKTLARGLYASARSSASMRSNIGPVTSFPCSALSNVKIRTSLVRSITTPTEASEFDEAIDSSEGMPARYTRKGGCVKCWHKRDQASCSKLQEGDFLYSLSEKQLRVAPFRAVTRAFHVRHSQSVDYRCRSFIAFPRKMRSRSAAGRFNCSTNALGCSMSIPAKLSVPITTRSDPTREIRNRRASVS